MSECEQQSGDLIIIACDAIREMCTCGNEMVGILLIPCVVGSHFEAPVTHRCAPVSLVSFPYVQLLLLEVSRRFDHVQESPLLSFLSRAPRSSPLTGAQLPNITQTVLY